MNFAKMQGNGNDFIIVEDFDNKLQGKESELAKHVCHRKFGIGADGLLIVRLTDKADIEMIIINSDGSYAAMCGNGIRCFIKYAFEKKIVTKEKINVLTGAGIKTISLKTKDGKVNSISVNMGQANFNPNAIPVKSNEEIINKEILANNKVYKITSLLMNIPHTVIFEEDNTNITEGNEIEKHPLFPEKTNVNFCKVINKSIIEVRTWERGAGATLGCGTGNCASAVVCNKLGFVDNKVKVITPGGSLWVHIKGDGVYMIGDAKFICEGTYNF
ncbi:diaminopimelate epimerase [Clostridium tarantellae]|uniref:Diaminopimelate epimerase n=1 Tax=Clostridium tarantellae TaxID=39493 RepID=A0A6I1MMA8_9CLOT|nr:diaminopimelate epimerase [Clostridium tarantellae]MPQ44636.1 diaminopimelate epimerase [Clostridium tarantellae]